MAPVVPRLGMPRTYPTARTAIPKMMKVTTGVPDLLLFTRLLRRLQIDGVFTWL
jgi:hypothetical protein